MISDSVMKRFILWIICLSLCPLVADAQISVVSVTLETDKGATIGLDDEMSATNVFSKEILSGQHTLIIKFNNEVVRSEVIDIPAGEAFRETYPIAGKVRISSNPIGTVSIDGKDLGSTPATVGLLGKHTIQVRYKNKKYKAASEVVNVLPMENIDCAYELKKNKRPWKYSWMILPQVTFPTTNTEDMKFGLMIARAKIVGWYVKGTLGFDSIELLDGDRSDLAEDVWPTGAYKVHYVNACAGLMLNVFKPLYLYGGAGIGWKKIGYQGYNGTYYCPSSDMADLCVASDFGLLLNIGHLAINGGCTLLDGKWAVNAGIGIKF